MAETILVIRKIRVEVAAVEAIAGGDYFVGGAPGLRSFASIL